MKITHYLHDLAVFPLSLSFRPASDGFDTNHSLLRGPIVFVPGLGCHRNWFDSAFRHGALQNHALLAIDLPGQGDSPNDAMSRQYRAINMHLLTGCVKAAIDLVAAFDDDGRDRINVVAHSMGAIPGYNAWSSIPIHRRGRFIAIEGNITGEDCTLASRKLAEGPEAVAEFIADLEASTDQAMRRWATDLKSCEPGFIAHLAEEIVTWCDTPENVWRPSKAKDTVYLYGDHTGFPEHHRERFAEIGVIDQEIERSGHFPMHDNPYILWNIVADAVRSSRAYHRDR